MQHYLERYAEAETQLLKSLEGCWHQALIIPAYRESPGFLTQTMPANNLLILIVNRPPEHKDCQWAVDIVSSLPPAVWQSEHLSLHKRQGNGDVLLIDRCLKGDAIPAKQGVGLARKIGADVACQLLATQRLQSHWLAGTDADASLPHDYWQTLARQKDGAACVFPFHHKRETATKAAITRYELHLHYYLAGLRYAHSPYAWPTIGSCIAVDATAYTQARGYPKKAGGEDFYLLNKLAKLGGVRHLPSPVIELSARLSDRVPFGTGPALQKIQALGELQAYTSYHPLSFSYLKAVLSGFMHAAHSGATPDLKTLADSHELNGDWLAHLWELFACNKAIEQALANSRSSSQAERHLMTWFDSFKTLKWMHASRDQFPDLPLPDCMEKANWLTIPDTATTDLDKLITALQTRLADNQLRGAGISTPKSAISREFINNSGH